MGGLGDIIPVLALGGAAQGYGQGMQQGRELAQMAQQQRYQNAMMGDRADRIKEGNARLLDQEANKVATWIANGTIGGSEAEVNAKAAAYLDGRAAFFGFKPGEYVNPYGAPPGPTGPPVGQTLPPAGGPPPADVLGGNRPGPVPGAIPQAPVESPASGLGVGPALPANLAPNLPPQTTSNFMGSPVPGMDLSRSLTPPNPSAPYVPMSAATLMPPPQLPTAGIPPPTSAPVPDVAGTPPGGPPLAVAPNVAPPSTAGGPPDFNAIYGREVGDAQADVARATADSIAAKTAYDTLAAKSPMASTRLAALWAAKEKADAVLTAKTTALAGVTKDSSGFVTTSSDNARQTRKQLDDDWTTATGYPGSAMQRAVIDNAQHLLSPPEFADWAKVHQVTGSLINTNSQTIPAPNPAKDAQFKRQGYEPTVNDDGSVTYTQPPIVTAQYDPKKNKQLLGEGYELQRGADGKLMYNPDGTLNYFQPGDFQGAYPLDTKTQADVNKLIADARSTRVKTFGDVSDMIGKVSTLASPAGQRAVLSVMAANPDIEPSIPRTPDGKSYQLPGMPAEMVAGIRAKGAETARGYAAAGHDLALTTYQNMKNQYANSDAYWDVKNKEINYDTKNAQLPGVIATSTFNQYKAAGATPQDADRVNADITKTDMRINNIRTMQSTGKTPDGSRALTATEKQALADELPGQRARIQNDNDQLTKMMKVNKALTGDDPQALMGQRLQELVGTPFGTSGCVRGARAFASVTGLPFPTGTDRVDQVVAAFPKYGIVPTKNPAEADFFVEPGSGGPNNPSGLHMGAIIGGKVAFQADTHGSTLMQQTPVPVGPKVVYYKHIGGLTPSPPGVTNPYQIPSTVAHLSPAEMARALQLRAQAGKAKPPPLAPTLPPLGPKVDPNSLTNQVIKQQMAPYKSMGIAPIRFNK